MSIKPANSLLLPLLCSAFLACLPAIAKPPATPAQSDTAFLAMAAQADMTSAHLGQLAENRAVESKVKDFAKTLSQDHTADYQQLSELSTKTGDAIPKAIDKQNDHTITTLDRYTGKTFDREFLEHQAAEHEKLVKAFKQEANHGANSDIKAYANQALPVIERHLHEVEDLLKTTGHKG